MSKGVAGIVENLNVFRPVFGRVIHDFAKYHLLRRKRECKEEQQHRIRSQDISRSLRPRFETIKAVGKD